MTIRSRLEETARHALVFSISAVLQQGASFFLLPLYMQYLSPADYGTVNLLLIARTLVFTLSGSAIGPSLFRSYYDYESLKERRVVTSTSLLMSVMLAGFFSVLGILFSDQLSILLTGTREYGFLTVLVLVTGVIQSVNTVVMAVFRAKKRSMRYAVLSLISMLTTIAVTVYLVVAKDEGISGVVWGGLAGLVVSGALGLYMIKDDLAFVISLREIRKITSYGLPFVPVNFISFGLNAGTRMIIQAFLGAAGVGLYALGKRLGQLVAVVIIAPFNKIAPAAIFSAENDPDARSFYSRLVTYYLVLTGTFALTISVISKDLLRLIADELYWEAWRIVPWIAAGIVLFGMRGLISVGLFLQRKTGWFPIAFGFGALVNILALIPLIQIMGVPGAGLAFLLGSIVICYIRFRAGQATYTVPFEYGRVFKFLAAAIATYFLYSIMPIASPIGGLVMGIGLCFVVMPAILIYLLRFLHPGEINYVKEHISRLQKDQCDSVNNNLNEDSENGFE